MFSLVQDSDKKVVEVSKDEDFICNIFIHLSPLQSPNHSNTYI